MPEWSKGYDLRSYGESLVGSNPTPSKEYFKYIYKNDSDKQLNDYKNDQSTILNFLLQFIIIKNTCPSG